MSSVSPRPILKRTPSSAPAHSNTSALSSSHRPLNHEHDRTRYAVHFPPSPSLTRTFSAYSSSMYDRSPIVVGPNTCALPERGCPGRTYTLEDSPRSDYQEKHSSSKGRHMHPRSMGSGFGLGLPYGDETREVITNGRYSSNLPPLVPDLSSSESDDSDGLFAATSQYMHVPSSPSPPAQDSFGGRCTTPINLSQSKDVSKQRRRVRSPSRRPPPSTQDESDDESIPTWNSYKSLSEKSLKSSVLAVPDEGCFGGF